jgi:uncharacterized protein YjbI with pentapeptide repeats
MGNPEIKNRFNNEIIIPANKYTSIKEAVERKRANLSGADLSRADLSWANLSRANLLGADLSWANLSWANLSRADLSWANLSRADLLWADLSGADLSRADLSWANPSRADLSWANLSEANLSEANLSGANLSGADLSEADLSRADLSRANLSGADLSWAEYKEPLFLPDLYLLKLQPSETKLRAWKYLKDGKSPYQNFNYEVGKTYKFDCDNDERILCSNGCNVATLTWCLKDSSKADEFIEVEFLAKDVIIPFATDGKFRVNGDVTIIRKINRKEAIKVLKTAIREANESYT